MQLYQIYYTIFAYRSVDFNCPDKIIKQRSIILSSKGFYMARIFHRNKNQAISSKQILHLHYLSYSSVSGTFHFCRQSAQFPPCEVFIGFSQNKTNIVSHIVSLYTAITLNIIVSYRLRFQRFFVTTVCRSSRY